MESAKVRKIVDTKLLHIHNFFSIFDAINPITFTLAPFSLEHIRLKFDMVFSLYMLKININLYQISNP
jgi:hypothetical protein